MSEDTKKLSDAERKKAEENSRRFTKWLRDGIISLPREATEPKKYSPSKAA